MSGAVKFYIALAVLLFLFKLNEISDRQAEIVKINTELLHDNATIIPLLRTIALNTKK